MLSCIADVSGSLDARKEAGWMEPGGCRSGEVVTCVSSRSAARQRWRVSNRHSCDQKTLQPAENKRPRPVLIVTLRGVFSTFSVPAHFAVFEFPFLNFHFPPFQIDTSGDLNSHLNHCKHGTSLFSNRQSFGRIGFRFVCPRLRPGTGGSRGESRGTGFSGGILPCAFFSSHIFILCGAGGGAAEFGGGGRKFYIVPGAAVCRAAADRGERDQHHGGVAGDGGQHGGVSQRVQRAGPKIVAAADWDWNYRRRGGGESFAGHAAGDFPAFDSVADAGGDFVVCGRAADYGLGEGARGAAEKFAGTDRGRIFSGAADFDLHRIFWRGRGDSGAVVAGADGHGRHSRDERS